MSAENRNKSEFIMIYAIALGIMARFLVMVWGYNFDFESYKSVGDIVSKGGNVYAETSRYNYAFIFSVIQGIGFSIFGKYEELFRVYIVGLLTTADIGIFLWIKKKYNLQKGLLFFLNPISVIITGYHNQFDNIAVLFALLASSYFDEESQELTKKDCIAILFLTLSMLTKHILFLFLVWIFFRKKQQGLLKRIAYSFTPVVAFMISFIPFVVDNQAALTGVIENVFSYRSYNNFPLLRYIFKIIMIPNQFYFLIYLIIMILLGLVYRKKTFGNLLLLYLVCMVTFSSAIANQYLIIPIVALVVYEKTRYFYMYEVVGTIYCILNGNELHLKDALISRIPQLKQLVDALSQEGGGSITLMAVILVLFLISIRITDSNMKASEANMM